MILRRLFRLSPRSAQPEREQAASAFERNGRLLFHPLNQTSAGVWRYAEPVLVSSRNHRDEIASHVRSVLAASQAPVPHEIEWSLSEMKNLFAAAGVRSYKSFAEGAKLVNIHQIGRTVSFVPTANLGKKGGWEDLQAQELKVDASCGDLAGALLAALDASLA